MLPQTSVLTFTGSRNGMTQIQKRNVWHFMLANPYKVYVHGDCVGSDEQFGKGALALEERFSRKIEIWTFPVNGPLYASSYAHKIHKRTNHLARNREMVDLAKFVIACPPTDEPQQRGGTWYTIRYAKKQNKHGLIFLPNTDTILPF